MAVGVFVVVAIRQIAMLLSKAFTASVIFAGLAIAIPAPVAEALCNGVQLAVVGEHRTTFPHGDVVRRVKAQCSNVAKGAYHLTTISCPQCITAILYQPQVVLFAQCSNHVEIKGVTQAMGKHYRFCFRTDGGFNFAGIYVVRERIHIHKDWYCAELQYGVDRGRETCRYPNNFITFFLSPDRPVLERSGR